MGYSDRMIRLYKWQPAISTPPTSGNTDSEPKGSLVQVDRWQLAGQVRLVTLEQKAAEEIRCIFDDI